MGTLQHTLSCFTLSFVTSLIYAPLKQFPISDPIRNILLIAKRRRNGIPVFIIKRDKQQGEFYEKNTINNAGMSFQVSKQHPSMIYSNLYRVKIIQLPVVSLCVQAVKM